ncbi:MAG: hypothetical protein SGI91_05920 [Alphaproteobacteria bacterium]|nr:hypothetical protein [Alphaproteobacteria bacterium]
MTHRSYSNQRPYYTQGVFSLALASRGLVPTRIHQDEVFEPRTSALETMKTWFVAVMAAVFAVLGLGQSLPTG